MRNRLSHTARPRRHCERESFALGSCRLCVNRWCSSGACAASPGSSPAESDPPHAAAPDRRRRRPACRPIAALGEQLFRDESLSTSGRLACQTCHQPEFAHAAPPTDLVSNGGPVMDIPGIRNSPSIRYASFTPPFGYDEEGTRVRRSVPRRPRAVAHRAGEACRSPTPARWRTRPGGRRNRAPPAIAERRAVSRCVRGDGAGRPVRGPSTTSRWRSRNTR